MKRFLGIATLTAEFATFWLLAQRLADPMVQDYRETEVTSLSDAMEQLYG